MKNMFAGLLLASTALASGQALAQGKTLYVAGYGGSYEQVVRKEIIPPFEAKTGMKVEYVAGNSTDTLAKLQAQKGNQQIDVIIVDDGPAYQAVALGFCGELAAGDVYKDVAPVMKFPSNKAVGIGMVATGFMVNKKAFEDNKWPLPTSWADLKDPKYKQKIVIPPINNTYGLHALIAEAQLAGGGEKNIEPGFEAFKKDINPNVIAYEPSPAKMTELFQNGQAIFAVWGSGRVKALADTGFPVEFIYPKEGGYALGTAACPVAGSKNEKEANAFVQHLLSPEIQVALAKGAGTGPANTTVKLSPEEQKGLPYGEQAKTLKAVDWDAVNAKREEWTKRWNREIER
ncbi:branched-chain amino acid ABC transporter substrate-binding protein [Alsobacter soli]|uniref:Branched-chain amino acid ABC transporter substrate-binding protein n=1 Tax=Alsobacter soli TaxID=2109933 RepID=A0A2T1HN91_9HYPH|nr:branched-chain amino acid ABC transporter substrate-binding protein [Alsobacter soli]